MEYLLLQPVKVPDGHYTGRWSGHRLCFDFGGNECQCETDRGVRGLNIPVEFDIRDGRVVESSIAARVTGGEA